MTNPQELAPDVFDGLSKNGKAAVICGRRGLLVFPCRERTTYGPGLDRAGKPKEHKEKSPYTANGCHDATTDLSQIAEWWRRWPDAAIGVRTGVGSGVFVVDVDVKNGAKGAESWAALQERNGEAPKTRTARTASNGRHYYFKHPGQGKVVKTNSGQIADGVDIRGDKNGYVIMPDSVVESGSYSWEHDIPTVDAPEWLLELVIEEPKPQPETQPRPPIKATVTKPWGLKILKDECQAIAEAPAGQRHDQLFKSVAAIGNGVGGGAIEGQEARAAIMAAVESWGTGAESEGKTLDTIEDALAKGISEPRSAPEDPDNTPASGPPDQWPAFVPFEESPLDLPPGILPGILGRFAEGLAEATQTPRELSAVNVLGVVALAVQHKLIVRVKYDYAEGVNLYALIASEPGERKSAIVSACKAPLVEWEAQQERQALAAIQEAISHRKTLEKAIEKARAKAANAKDADARKQAMRDVHDMEKELPEVPSLPRLLVDDCTPEAMAEVMAGNGESIGMLEAEGGALDTLAGRYSSGVPNLDLVLKSYSGEPVAVDRKNRPPIRLRNPRITMILTPQPPVLRTAGSNPAFMGRGLIGRCLLILPRPLVGFRDNDKTMPESLSREWHAYVDSLLTIPAQTNPHEITLTKGAYDLWLDFSKDVERAQRPGEEFEFLRAWASKATGLVVRIAGLFHLAEGPKILGTPIPPTTMQRAIGFTAWAAVHAKYAFSSFGMDEGQEAGKRALEWLRRERKAVVTASEIYQAIRGRFPKMDQVRPGIAVLVDRGVLVPREKERRAGRPSDTYDVNPAIFGGDYGAC